MTDAGRDPFETRGISSLMSLGDQVRLNIAFPDGNAWADWSAAEATNIRDGLTMWLDAQAQARGDGGRAR